MAKTKISATEALKAFKGKSIEVQEARFVKKTDDAGKVREVADVKMAPLAEKHVLDAAQYDDGRVTIVTIDGRRHEARA